MPSTEWVHSLKVVDLKEECKKRGLPVGGKKAELVERLEAWIAENEKGPEGEAAGEEPASAAKEEEQAGEQEEPAAQEEPVAAEAEEEEEKGEPAAAEQEEQAAAAEAPAADEAAEAQEPAPAAEAAPAEQEAAAAPEEAAAAPMEAEAAAEPPTEAAAADDAKQAPAAGQAEASPAQQQQPAAMEADQPTTAAQAPQQPAAAADVDLDYGEDSDGEGAAAAADQPEQREKQADEGAKRKREEEQAAAAPRRVSGSRGPSADKALAAAASAERPSKVARSGSGFSLSNAEKGEAPAPEDVPEAAEHATRALRIDGFVRPFTERQVRDLLSETGQVLALWMPSIKTHAYCVFETKAQAEATRRATYQLQWPATNPKRLAPRFVPLTEAETAIGTGAGNPDFRLKRTEEDGEAEGAAAPAAAAAEAKPASEGSKEAAAPVVDRSKREWNRNRRSPSPPLEGVRDLREMLSRKASGGRSADAAGPSRGASEREAVQVPPGLGRAAERRSDPEPERRGSRGREEHPVRTLDELFRKTTAKPCIYWLPLTDEQVAEKKRKAAAAPEQGKQPAANGSAEKKR